MKEKPINVLSITLFFKNKVGEKITFERHISSSIIPALSNALDDQESFTESHF